MSPVVVSAAVTVVKDKRFWKFLGGLLIMAAFLTVGIGQSCTANNLLVYQRDTVTEDFDPIVEPINAKIEGEKINSFLLHALYISLYEKPNVSGKQQKMKQLTECFYTTHEEENTYTDEEGVEHHETKTVYEAVMDTDEIFQKVSRKCGITIKPEEREYVLQLSYFFSGAADNTYIPSADSDDETITEPGKGGSIIEGATPVVYYNQCDPQYRNHPYGTDNIGGYACGPTSMAIVISSLTSTKIDPIQMSKWSYDHGYWCKGSGSYRSLIPAAAKAFGLKSEICAVTEKKKLLNALASGKLVVAIMGKGHFCSAGHYIVLRGATKEGKILVADCANRRNNEKEWPASIILNEVKNDGGGGPFWIISR